jgi:conjugative relaxase-like TrwC/TraI family protein
MSLHKLTAGSGYDYLTRQIAAMDATEKGHVGLAAYYAERGESPGVWVGSGLSGMDGVDAGDPVTAEQMRALFGHGLHPLADASTLHVDGSDITLNAVDDAMRLGAPFRVVDGATPFRVEVAKRIADLNALIGAPADPEVAASSRARIRTEVGKEFFHAEHGRDPVDARELAAQIAKDSRPRSQTVAGYDLTFSPVKSFSTLWAVADSRTAAAIERTHQAAMADALRFLEEQALFTRTGPQGIRQVNVQGVVAAAFTHRDSRAGDPDLHTHVAVANKIQTLDGRWLSIDGRVLFKAKVAASETYNTALERHLRDALGVRFAERPGTDPAKRPVREIVGIDPRLNQRWSSRRALINARRGELAVQFQADHGRPPTAVEALHLAQQATLETRDAKHEPRSHAEQRATWLAEAAAVLGGRDAVTAMVAAALAPATDAARVGMPAGSARPPIGSWRCWRRAGRPGKSGMSAPKPNARPAPSTSRSISPTA